MKKLLSAILAVAMMFALATTVFAVPADPVTGLGDHEATATITVSTDNTIVYGVTVAWELDFAYSFGKWNAEAVNWDNSRWTDATGTITVTNKSNFGVTYNVKNFVANGVGEGVIIAYSGDAASDTLGDASVSGATQAVINVTASGTPKHEVKDSAAMGTITVTITPESPM